MDLNNKSFFSPKIDFHLGMIQFGSGLRLVERLRIGAFEPLKSFKFIKITKETRLKAC